MRKYSLRHAVIAVCALLLASGMFFRCEAQTTYGSIVGTARDPSGAVIVGAQVTVTNVATGVKATQATNDVGAYSFTTLFPGPYTIHAEMHGFQSVDIRDIQLQINQTVRFDLTMPVGQVTQSVEVTATLAALATDTSDVGEVVASHQLVDLPLNGRQFVQLATLTSDVYLSPPNNAGDSAGNQVMSEGGRLFSNSYLLDGVDIRVERGGSYGVSPTVDALSEFKLMQNTYSAQYGFGQTVVTTSINNGTNHFHGDAWDFLRNDALDANYSFNPTGKLAPLRQNQFGFAVGGPIRKQKLFFFASYEGTRLREANVTNVLEPTAAQLGGNLSGMATAIDPTTGQPFSGNQIPSGRISKFALAAAQFYPAPHGPAAPGFNLAAFTGYSSNNDQGLARLDYYINTNNRLNGFVSVNSFADNSPGPNPYNGMIDTRKGYPIVGAEYIHIFSPTLLNDLHFGYANQVIYEGQGQLATGNLPVTLFGLQNVSPDAFAAAIPEIDISGFQMAGPQEWQPTGTTNIDTQFNDIVTVTRGHHILKLGGDFRRITYQDFGWATQNGTLTFNGQYTGNPMADFLLGIPNYAHLAQKGAGDYPYTLEWAQFAGFAQDDWKLTPQLTLNLGLRWEFIQNPREIHNEYDNWDMKTQTMLYAGKTMPERIYPMQKDDLGPRLGLAYSPKWLPKTVFRGGFSILDGDQRLWEAALFHFQPPYVNEMFLYNEYPTPNFTSSTLFPTPVTSCCAGVDLTQDTVYTLNRRLTPKYYEWNFNIQRELPHNFLLQVGYVGTAGRELPIRYNADQATPYDPNNPTSVLSREPYPLIGYIGGNAFNSYSSFNALEIKVERRFAHGFAITGVYDWQKDMEVTDQDENSAFDINHLNWNYGPYYVAQHAVIDYIYELPFGPGKALLGNSHGVLGRLVGGWQFDGITTIESGNYLSATSDFNNGVGGRAGNYADVVPGQNPNSGPNIHTIPHWFNTAAFAEVPYPRYGNAGAGTIVGPGMWNFDLSLFKNIKFTESKSLQLRGEAFNAFNHVNLGNPNTDVSAGPVFGVVGSAAPARIMQVALKLYF
jgi:hypothetical protein